MTVQDPELSAETPYSEHFMAPAAGDPTAVLAELKAIRRQIERQSSEARFLEAMPTERSARAVKRGLSPHP